MGRALIVAAVAVLVAAAAFWWIGGESGEVVSSSSFDAGTRDPRRKRKAPLEIDDGFCTADEQPYSLRWSIRNDPLGDAGEHGRWQVHLEVYRGGALVGSKVVEPQAAGHKAGDLYRATKELGDGDEALASLRQMRALEPQDPGIALALAMRTMHQPDLDEAIDGLETFTGIFPLPGLVRRRARLEVARDIQRTYSRKTQNGVTLLWPGESLTEQRALDVLAEIDRALDQAATLTGTSRKAALLAVSCAPTWTGGMFDGTLRLVAASTDAGVDLVALRHETLHAQLRVARRRVPDWFHEGVAQTFSRARDPANMWKVMVQNRSWVPFTPLDETFQIFGTDEAELAYSQAYAMVELMRECGGDPAVAAAVKDFSSGADTSAVLAHACPGKAVTGPELLEFLRFRVRL